MAKQTLYVLPSATQPIGQIGPLTSAAKLKTNPQGWKIELTNTADWPTNGQPVCELVLEVAHDGVSHAHDFSIALAGVPWVDNKAVVGVNGGWSDDRDERDARLTVKILQPCTLGLTWTAL